jgi:flagellar biosynthesis protein FlhF
MAEALAQVKKDLGRDAIILHTRQIKVGGVMGVGGRTMVEITASAPDAKLVQKHADRAAEKSVARAASAGSGASASGVATLDRAAGVADTFEPASFRRVSHAELAEPAHRRAPDPGAPRTPAPSLEPKVAHAAEVSTRSVDPGALRRPGARPTSPSILSPLASRTSFAPGSELADRAIQDELASIKRLVGQVLQCSRQAALSTTLTTVGAQGAGAAVLALGGMPEALFGVYTALLEQGVSPEIADLLAGRVRDALTTPELQDPAVVHGAMLDAVGSLLPQAQDTWTGGRRVVALVGPTGVGKTTTIAKLAALCKLRDRMKVGLVTADTYRIAAVEQLRTYANIIGLPLRVALTPAQMKSEIAALADCDVVLVDTAGRSQHDQTRLDELRAMADAAEPSETHLVLSASASEVVQRRIVDSFGTLGPDRLIFTKLDEAVNLGSLINVTVRAGKPLSFVTLGQEVPDDIAPAEPRRVARMVMEGCVTR